MDFNVLNLPHCSAPPLPLFSQFKTNSLRISNPKRFVTRKRHYKISLFKISSSKETNEKTAARDKNYVKSTIFGGKKELSGLQAMTDSMSSSMRLASSAIVVEGALAAGYGLGFHFGGSRSTGLGGAVVLGAASGAAVYALNSCIPDVAAVNLHNLVVECDDPGALRREDVEKIAERYGVSKQNDAFNAELCDLYSRYLIQVCIFYNSTWK